MCGEEWRLLLLYHVRVFGVVERRNAKCGVCACDRELRCM